MFGVKWRAQSMCRRRRAPVAPLSERSAPKGAHQPSPRTLSTARAFLVHEPAAATSCDKNKITSALESLHAIPGLCARVRSEHAVRLRALAALLNHKRLTYKRARYGPARECLCGCAWLQGGRKGQLTPCRCMCMLVQLQLRSQCGSSAAICAESARLCTCAETAKTEC